MEAIDKVKQPELEKPPRRTRKERVAQAEEGTKAVEENMNPPEEAEPGKRIRRTRKA